MTILSIACTKVYLRTTHSKHDSYVFSIVRMLNNIALF